jgi:MFS transporter, DHA1 family, multidrug resistance protein
LPATSSRGLIVANLLGQMAFGLLAMTICIPSMQEWAATFGASQSRIQLTFGGFIVAYGSLQLVYGPLSDRLGRKPVLMFGLALACAGSVLAALAPGLDTLIVARVLQGAGAAAGMVVGRAMVQDLFVGPERTRVMAYIGMTMGLCPPLATILGGQLHVAFGWASNFWLMSLLSAGLLLSAWWGLPATRPPVTTRPAGVGDMLRSYGRLAREPQFGLFVVILGLTTATFYAFLGGAPLVLGSYGIGPDGIGYYIMCIPLSYIVGNYLTTHLVHRIGERWVMALGQISTLTGIGTMVVLDLAGLHTPLAFTLPLTLLGMGHGLLVPPTLAGTVGLLPALAGSAAAVAGLMQQLMGAVGGYAVGLFTHEDARHLGWLMLGLAACAALAQLRLLRRWHRPV